VLANVRDRTTRRTHAEALTAITTTLLTDQRGKPDDKLIRKALCRWAFNTAPRDEPGWPADVSTALRWITTHGRPVVALAKPDLLRSVLDHLTVRLDGTAAAPSVVTRRRKICAHAGDADSLRLPAGRTRSRRTGGIRSGACWPTRRASKGPQRDQGQRL
jgi:hypothetical protein